MYIDSINKNNNDNCLSAFGNVLICSNAIDANKTITFPIGYSVEDDLNLSFKILFVNGHNCIDDSTHMTLSDGSNTYPIVVNKDGTLIPLPIHTMTEESTTVYKSLQPNTILEMYYDSNYGDDGAFVVIGNPIVLSSNDYTIYANGYDEERSYSTEEVNTGKNWIDGKTIYRKVIDCGALPNNTTKEVAHNISNVDRFIRYYGTTRANSGTTLDIPYLDDNGYNYSVFVYLNNTDIRVITKADRSAYTSTYIILEYTKTTD